MDTVWVIAIGVVIAAFIGGMTNYLAIRMLFRPRSRWMIGGFHVPFTPGLIPKRREEIASSLGRVVADYLVTTSGLSGLLRKAEFRQMVTDKLMGRVRSLAGEERVLGDCLLRLFPEWSKEELIERVSSGLHGLARSGLDYLWVEKGGAGKRVGELIPNWSAARREEFAQRGAVYIAQAVRSALHAPEGERMILRMTTQFIEQAGGFLGTMAAIFMDEHKTASKVRLLLSDALSGETVIGVFRQLIARELEKAEGMTLEEIVRAIAPGMDDQSEAWMERWINALPLKRWTEELTSLRVDETVGKYMHVLEEKVPALVDVSLRLLERNVDRIFAAVRLEHLVEEQVQAFPIERLEQIILNISGREFRAITWLGALLGGFIGLFQGLLMQWLS